MKPPNKKQLNRWLAEEFLGWKESLGDNPRYSIWMSGLYDESSCMCDVGDENFFNPEGRELIEDELVFRNVHFDVSFEPDRDGMFDAQIAYEGDGAWFDKCKYTALYTAIWRALK